MYACFLVASLPRHLGSRINLPVEGDFQPPMLGDYSGSECRLEGPLWVLLKKLARHTSACALAVSIAFTLVWYTYED